MKKKNEIFPQEYESKNWSTERKVKKKHNVKITHPYLTVKLGKTEFHECS